MVGSGVQPAERGSDDERRRLQEVGVLVDDPPHCGTEKVHQSTEPK